MKAYCAPFAGWNIQQFWIGCEVFFILQVTFLHCNFCKLLSKLYYGMILWNFFGVPQNLCKCLNILCHSATKKEGRQYLFFSISLSLSLSFQKGNKTGSEQGLHMVSWIWCKVVVVVNICYSTSSLVCADGRLNIRFSFTRDSYVICWVRLTSKINKILYGTNGPAMLCTSWMCVICVCKVSQSISTFQSRFKAGTYRYHLGMFNLLNHTHVQNGIARSSTLFHHHPHMRFEKKTMDL